MLVLDAIRAAGEIARIDISDATGLSPATLTAITSDLLQTGLIEEIIPESKVSQPRRGRPRVAIRLAAKSHLIAGVKVGHKVISVLVLDFGGNEVVSQEFPVAAPQMAPEVFVKTALDAISKTCELGGFGLDKLSGIGLSLAGLVKSKDGFVYWSSSLTERNVDLGSLLQEAAPCPVFIDNDANLVAKAENLFGEARGIDNFVVVTVEHGVGMGVFVDGKLYRGARGCGAELGHTKVQLNGALCQCGMRGCLEAYVGDYALLREADSVAGKAQYQDIAALFKSANDGDSVANSVLERAANMLALGVGNVINIFDPELIILAGSQLSYRHLFEDKIIKYARDHATQVDAKPTPIKVHAWGDLMWAKGAAAFAIDEVAAMKIQEVTRA